jgi:tetratricopeptide (TPR) repeat protein
MGVALVLLLATVSHAGPQELAPALAERFNEGVAALKEGRLPEAERTFRDVLAAGGTHAYVHHNLGLVLREQGRHREALAAFRAAIVRDAGFAPARLLAGTALLALDRPVEAVRELERAVRLTPTLMVARLQLAEARERAGDLAGLVDELRAIVALAPAEAEHAYRLGRAYLRLSQSAHERLRALRPASARASQALGREYAQQGQTDLALAAYADAARLDPTLPDVALSLARLFVDRRRWADAEREVERALALEPESRDARELQAAIRDARRQP